MELDLYKRNRDLKQLAADHPGNELLTGRGLPGTHDLQLAKTVLASVANSPETYSSIPFPIFDKSLFNGEGDRAVESVSIQTPIDIFILEGWSVGFAHLPAVDLEKLYKSAKDDFSKTPKPYFLSHSLEALLTVNNLLAEVEQALYRYFSVFVRFSLHDLGYIKRWRWEQEVAMMATGRTGMTEEQVETFVRRYLPGYELWADRITTGEFADCWKGGMVTMELGENREVLNVEFS